LALKHGNGFACDGKIRRCASSQTTPTSWIDLRDTDRRHLPELVMRTISRFVEKHTERAAGRCERVSDALHDRLIDLADNASLDDDAEVLPYAATDVDVLFGWYQPSRPLERWAEV